MATPGDTYEIPTSGERFTFLETSATTGGELLAWRLDLEADADLDLVHAHPEQTESFTVQRGRLAFTIDGRTTEAGVGETVTVAPGQNHALKSIGGEPAELRVELRPALRSEEWMETVGRLVAAGEVGRNGLPGLLQMAVTLREYKRELVIAQPPRAVQNVVFPLLAAIGRIAGRQARVARIPQVATDAL